jgi:hypothetical protein
MVSPPPTRGLFLHECTFNICFNLDIWKMWLQMSYSEHGAELPCTVKFFFFLKKACRGVITYQGSVWWKQDRETRIEVCEVLIVSRTHTCTRKLPGNFACVLWYERMKEELFFFNVEGRRKSWLSLTCLVDKSHLVEKHFALVRGGFFGGRKR